MRLGIAVFCIAAGCGAPSQPPSTAPDKAAAATLSAEQIVLKSAQAYGNARTYADRGTSVSVFSTGERVTKTFSTAYARPARFRFEFRDDQQAAAQVIWTDQDAYWMLRPGAVIADPDLATPLDAATGVSSGVAALIPTLLFPDQGPFFVHIMKLAIAGETTIGGHRCWQISGEQPGSTITVSIDRESYLVRRVVRHLHVEQAETFDVDQTIDYEPRLDGNVADAELRGPDLTGVAVQRVEKPKWIGVLFEQNSNRVREVLPGSPAERAGVRPGDLVVTFAGIQIVGISDVIKMVQVHKAGDVLDVVIERGGARVTLPVKLEYRPNMEKLQQSKLLNKVAPGFELANLAGGKVKLADFKGKVVVIDFWATWCKPCIASMPTLNQWHTRLGPKGLVILGVTDDEEKAVKDSVAEHKLLYTIALDSDRNAWRDYLVQGLPTTVVVDQKGMIRYVSIGAGEEAAIEAVLTKLLK